VKRGPEAGENVCFQQCRTLAQRTSSFFRESTLRNGQDATSPWCDMLFAANPAFVSPCEDSPLSRTAAVSRVVCEISRSNVRNPARGSVVMAAKTEQTYRGWDRMNADFKVRGLTELTELNQVHSACLEFCKFC
jgi:hypothetical protein